MKRLIWDIVGNLIMAAFYLLLIYCLAMPQP